MQKFMRFQERVTFESIQSHAQNRKLHENFPSFLHGRQIIWLKENVKNEKEKML